MKQTGNNARVVLVAMALAGIGLAAPVAGQIVISGNENKIDITSGGPKVVPNAAPDTLSIIDFAQSPPKVTNISGVTNTVVGPPSNIAISPDGKMALIANSLKLDPAAPAGTSPENHVHILDLTASPPKVVGQVQTDLQPSGISFTPDGRMALVANRAAGTVSVLAVDGMNVKQTAIVKVSEPAESVSDVAISPDGKLALASVQKGGYLAVLAIADGKVTPTGTKVSVYGQPYRCVITPDGDLAVTAGQGFGNGVDIDAMTVVDLKATPRPVAIDHIPVGAVPESLEISPDGKLIAVVVMEGSNLGPDNPLQTKAGAVVILKRSERSFVQTQRLPVGRIPEGVAFTGDGKHLLVQCHPDRQVWIFRVGADGKVEDTQQRLEVPGMPSSMRAAMLKR